MRKWMPAVPALGTFGPIEMVLGIDSPYHVVSLIAALVTATGIMILFATVMEIINGEAPPRPPPSLRMYVFAALVGVVLSAVLTAYLIFRRTH